MEVHAHTHTADPDSHRGKKKWTHYFWEFLMLFLAVFCGFLAENIREHAVEHQREKQYMMTMLEDLKSDTALLNQTVKYWKHINAGADSVADAITFPLSTTDFLKVYCNLNKALDYYSFNFNDRTITQLKNAGGFRLIRKKNVANKIIAYDQFNNDAMRNIAYQHNKFYENVALLRNKVFVQDIINKIFSEYNFDLPPASSHEWIVDLINNNKSPFSIETQTELSFEFKNALLAYRKDFSNMEFGYNHLLKYQQDLIKLLGEEYHLK